MSFTFYNDIPASANNPSDDQPLMLQNNTTHPQIWNVDHISFNNPDGGKHKQITFQDQYVPSAPTDPESIVYTDIQSGTAFSNSQLYFKNSGSPYLLNCVRAFGSLTFNAGFSYNNSYNMNIASITTTLSTLTLSLNSNVVIGNNVIIIPYLSNVGSASQTIRRYTFSNPSVTFTTSAIQWSNGNILTFIILQA